ncbi:hypothetical protein E2562_010807 [Oryza meyeriana var. granulata]|uniref:Uncharacterized protein n=1 Tax=Oryza meyeriana var. granulata TaxID=110450 RepID=A0A6G1BJC6_9ORYZ|nr:hypothetical protein E2562_010807 [Oryza meyeriana var. granulata]
MIICCNHGSEEEYSQVDPDGADEVDGSPQLGAGKASIQQLILDDGGPCSGRGGQRGVTVEAQRRPDGEGSTVTGRRGSTAARDVGLEEEKQRRRWRCSVVAAREGRSLRVGWDGGLHYRELC